MKKTITIIIGFFAIMCLSSSVYAAAATWAQASAGANVTVGAGSTQLTFTASPGVLVNGASDILVYCILTGNSKAGTNAIVYNVTSGNGKVAQKAVSAALTDLASLGTPTDTGLIVDGFTTR